MTGQRTWVTWMRIGLCAAVFLLVALVITLSLGGQYLAQSNQNTPDTPQEPAQEATVPLVEEQIKTGWVHTGNKDIYIKEDGKQASSEWVTDGGSKYWIGADGAAVTGWQDIDNTTYYFEEDGRMHTGWAEQDGSWYYLKDDGTRAVSVWVNTENEWYYLKSDGTPAYNEWIYSGDSVHYLGEDGRMATDRWILVDGGWCHVDENGYPQTGWIEVDGLEYYLDDNGILATDRWVMSEGSLYYLDDDGALTSYGVDFTYRAVDTPEGRVVGWLFAPEDKDNAPLIIFSHGLTGAAWNFMFNALALASQGIAVYTFDFIGGSKSSLSGGDIRSMSVLTESVQLNAIIEDALTWEEIDPGSIFLAGHSQGALVSTLVASYRSDICGTILLSPALNLGEKLRASFSSLKDVPETFTFLGKTLGRRYATHIWSIKLTDVLRRYTGYSLVVHGMEDTVISPLVSLMAKLQWRDKCSLHMLSGITHNETLLYDSDLIGWICEFVEEHG